MRPEAQDFFRRQMVEDVTRRVAPFAKMDQNPLHRELPKDRVKTLVGQYGAEVKALMAGVLDGSVKIREATARLQEIVVSEELERNTAIWGTRRNIDLTAESTRKALEGANPAMAGERFSDFLWIIAETNAVRRGERREAIRNLCRPADPLRPSKE